MAHDQDFFRFLVWCGLVIAGGVIGAVTLVVIVDPYRIHQVLEVSGFNQTKPAPDRYREEIKLTGAKAMNANAFILGNSRAEVGFDPEHPIFSAKRLSVYNLALAGTNVSTARREFDYLRKQGQKAAVIVLGLDFLDFLGGAPKPAIENNSGSHAADGLKWKFDTIFSLNSVADAIKTLKIQHAQEAETMTSRGLNPLHEYQKYAREQGYYALFRQRAIENAKTYARKRRDSAAAGEQFQGRDQLDAILSAAAIDGTEIHLVIYPYHAQILAMFEQADLWPSFERWKTILIGDITAIQQKYPNSKVTLWDFSGYSRYQCEAIPGRDEKHRNTQWYWEAGHFKRELGNLVIDRLFGSDAEGEWGVALSQANDAANRARIARERAACLTANPRLFEEVVRLTGGTHIQAIRFDRSGDKQ